MPVVDARSETTPRISAEAFCLHALYWVEQAEMGATFVITGDERAIALLLPFRPPADGESKTS